MADAPEVKNPPPHSPDNVVGDTVDEVVTPFVQPPASGPVELPSLYVDTLRHAPAGPDTDFRPPRAHVPDGVVGDQRSEVFTPQEPPPPYSPDRVVGDVLSEVVTPYVDVPAHSPDNVVGDALDEVLIDYVDVPPHAPDNVVGDSLDEVGQPTLDPPMGPPAEPFDVPTTPSAPPREVTDDDYGGPGEAPGVPVASHVPASPRDPGEPERAPGPAGPSFPGGSPPAAVSTGGPLSYAEMFAQVEDLDARLARHIRTRGDDPYSEGGGAYAAAGSRALDPQLYVRWLRDYLASVGVGGALEFVAVQSALHSMNAKYGRVFNTAYLAMRLPYLNSATAAAVDVSPRVHSDMVSLEEELLTGPLRPEQPITGRMADGTPITFRDFNAYSEDQPLGEGAPLNFGGVVDVGLEGELPADDPVAASQASRIMVDVEMGAGGHSVLRKQVDHRRLFEPDGVRLRPGLGRTRENQVLARSAFNWRGSRGVIPAGLTADDDRFGYVVERVPDDVAYMPLVFTDLRPMRSGELRHVYFRALNVKTGETLNPSWNEEQFFGRVDPAVGYQATTREIRLSFSCQAFAPEDLPVIYRKRAWLSSMVYPELSAAGSFKSGPVVRFRLGDLYSNSRGGLTSIIRSIDYDDSEQVWELKNGMRVPQGFAVSLTLLVLHEGVPGVVDGHFTVSQLSREPLTPGETADVAPAGDEPTLFAQIMPGKRE